LRNVIEQIGRRRARTVHDNAYSFGAICPARRVGAALALPYVLIPGEAAHQNEMMPPRVR
jgi:hypothetical protein